MISDRSSRTVLLTLLGLWGTAPCGSGLTRRLTPGSGGVSGSTGGDVRDHALDDTTGSDAPSDAGLTEDGDGDAPADGDSDAPADGDAPDDGDDRAPDASAPMLVEPGQPRRCSPTDPFGLPVRVPGLNDSSGSVVSARFSPDELTAYLGLQHGVNTEIYVAKRSGRGQPFGLAAPISAVNSPSVEQFATATGDGLGLYLESPRSGKFRIYASERASVTDDFPPAVELTLVDSIGDGDPYVVPDGSALYFHTFRTSHFDVYRATRVGGTFGRAEPVDIDTTADETCPVVSADELTIYFRRPENAPGALWMATRRSKSEAFSAAIALTGLNGPETVACATWISPDDCRLYLQEQDAIGGVWVYVAERVASPPDP